MVLKLNRNDSLCKKKKKLPQPTCIFQERCRVGTPVLQRELEVTLSIHNMLNMVRHGLHKHYVCGSLLVCSSRGVKAVQTQNLVYLSI